VLDPFAGVGTSLVEAMLYGHETIGFEINPYAALACQAKLEAFEVDVDTLIRTISQLEDFYNGILIKSYHPFSTPPSGFKTRGVFYSPKVLKKVLVLQDFISSIENQMIQDLFRLAFAATMVTYSNYSYEPSLSQRKSAGRDNVEDYPVLKEVLSKLNEMVEDATYLKDQSRGRTPRWKIFNHSFFDCMDKLPRNSVDLIVTSPPYLNNYHYNRNTRPHLYWLGYAKHHDDIRPLEYTNFGKFWQTVRGETCVDLNFELKGKEIKRNLKELRLVNAHRGVYGGNGWANYAASYFNDCHRFAKCTKYLLKRGGSALIVIGNSILQGIMIPTDRYLGEIAESVGLKLVDIHVPRATRVGNSIIQSEVRAGKAPKAHKLYEAIVELKKM